MDKRIRVLNKIYQSLLHEGIHALLSDEPDLEIIESELSLKEIERSRKIHPHIVLLDLCQASKEEIHPPSHSHSSPKYLILLEANEFSSLIPYIKLGVQGFLLKEACINQVKEAIKTLAAGGAWIQPELAAFLFREITKTVQRSVNTDELPLTARELQIVKMVAIGNSNLSIAQELSLSESTIKVHVSNILRKLELKNRSQITRFALKMGLISH
jgi:DNA-binding NarL/FixJ family response regulator